MSAIARSFHFVIVPRKIPASTAGVNFKSTAIPAMLYVGTTAPTAAGKCRISFGAPAICSSDEQIAGAPKLILHFPAAVGAVVPTYNIAGIAVDLKFTPAVLAGIFLGTITKWNDRAIADINPGVHLPPGDIVPIHRS